MDNIELIVLGTTKVGESAMVVHTLSREYGRRGFLVRSAKKAGTALLLPLSILEADVVENPKSDLWAIRNLHLRDALNGIRGNLEKNTISLFLSEVLFRTLREGSYEDGLYEWCTGSILTLDAGFPGALAADGDVECLVALSCSSEILCGSVLQEHLVGSCVSILESLSTCAQLTLDSYRINLELGSVEV